VKHCFFYCCTYIETSTEYSLTDDTTRVHYRRCNKKKRALALEHPEVSNDPKMGFRDLTDKENVMFQYSY